MNSDERQRVRIGLIGCGGVALSVHLPILRRLGETEVVALAEADPQRLEAASRRAPRADKTSDYRQLLDRNDVDAVVICLPSALHAPVAIEAMDRGKHVYLEKPIGIDREQGEQLLRAWQASGVVAMVGFNYRFNTLNLQARAMINAGAVDRVVAVRSIFSTMQDDMPSWKRWRQSGGGALLDLASHEIDLVRFILGEEIAAVSAGIRSVRSEDDTAWLHLKTESGVPVQCLVSLGAAEDCRLEVLGESGRIEVRRFTWTCARLSGVRAAGRLGHAVEVVRSCRALPYWFKKLRSPVKELSFAAALSHFARAVRGECRPAPDLLDGYRSLAVVLAAEESARTGRTVAPAQPLDTTARRREAAGVA